MGLLILVGNHIANHLPSAEGVQMVPPQVPA